MSTVCDAIEGLTMRLDIDIEDALANEASAVYEKLGIDMNIAIKMFLKRTVLEQRLPFSVDVSASSNEPSKIDANARETYGNAITSEMTEDIWRRFCIFTKDGGDLSSLAQEAHASTGMNRGSAFIYLCILDNLVHGCPNTRTMKIKDLEYYMGQIRDNSDAQSYMNAIESLKLSLPYWENAIPGQFAQKVKNLIETHEASMLPIPASDTVVLFEHDLFEGLGIEREDDESLQDHVKRVFAFLMWGNYLDMNEIEQLKTKEYTKKVIGLDDAFLGDERWIDEHGHYRAWADPIFGYYLCSQWNKNRFYELEPNFRRWVAGVVRKSRPEL